jgi:hypothetical protein
MSTKTSAVSEELLGGRKYPFSYTVSECLELVEAIVSLNKEDTLEEVQDVLYAIQMYVYQCTGFDFTLRFCKGSLDKFRARRHVWVKILAAGDIDFHCDYLKNGSNYLKVSKIILAFKEAGKSISEDEVYSIMKGLDLHQSLIFPAPM